MLLLTFLLVPVVLADVRERTINNYVVKIDGNTLKSVQPTEVLDLSGLDLKVLEKDAFNNLVSVKNLNLGNNSLSSIPNVLFSKLGNLEHLSLADNTITKFEKSFEGLDHLKTLNISNNPLTKFEGTDLSGLPKSSVVFTKGLSISTINAYVFEKEPGSPNKYPAYLDDDYYDDEDDRDVGNDTKSTNEAQNNSDNLATQKSKRKRDVETYPDIKICIHDDVLKMVEPLSTYETLPSGCQKANLNESTGLPILPLGNLGIARVEKGWFRLNWTLEMGLYIDLSGNKIVQLTSELLNDLPPVEYAIDLSSNKIERLNRGVINNSYISGLLLNSNRISEIDAGAFENMPLLDALYLHDNLLTNTKFAATLPINVQLLALHKNKITEITSGSFSGFRHLYTLLLDQNFIQEVKSDSLQGLSSLSEIDLSNNRITRIEPGSFNLQKMNSIVLSNNSIASIERGVFDSRVITRLDISNNKLTNIKDAFPDGFYNLKLLNLDYNEIQKLERDTFKNASISFLSLRGNKISSIERGSLFHLQHLETLSLDKNLLSELNSNSFRGLKRLEKLTLIENGITSIPQGFTQYMPSLDVLDLSNNPIKRLQNGALYGFRRTQYNVLHLNKVPVEVIEGGLFDDM